MAIDGELESLRLRLSRERRARREAEAIAERSTRELYQVIEDLRRSQGELDSASGLVALLQRAAVAANEASELEEAAAIVLGEVCRYMKWPVGHLYVSTGHDEMMPTTVWHLEDPERFRVFREVTEASRLHAGGSDSRSALCRRCCRGTGRPPGQWCRRRGERCIGSADRAARAALDVGDGAWARALAPVRRTPDASR